MTFSESQDQSEDLLDQPPRTGANAWPASFALAAAIGGLSAAVIAIGIVAAIVKALGGDVDGAPFTIVATIIQGVTFLLTALALARSRGPLRAPDFGLQAIRVKRAAWVTLGVGATYYALLVLYSSLVHLEPDSTPTKLGANNGDAGIAGLVIAAVLIAPFVEEIFFRGMIFRSLRNGVGVVAAAVLSGLFFGMLHWDFATVERLLQVIPLIAFGIALALLYAWSGSLWGSIVLHGTNNALASGVVASNRGSELGVALTVLAWLTVTGGCFKMATRRLAESSPTRGNDSAAEKSEPTADLTGD